jgi:PAS domain S-box-containing protein
VIGFVKRAAASRLRVEERMAAQTEELSRQADELLRGRLALETQTLLFQSVLDGMTEGLVAADAQGKFVLWNPAAERIIGMGAANVPHAEWSNHYGVYMSDTVTPFPADENPLTRAIHGEASTAVMFVRNPKVAEGAWIEASGSPLRDRNGVACGGVAAFRDITQRKLDEQKIHNLNAELEEKVVQRTAQLEMANRELEAFTYSVSHDLRAPLRHIAGFSRILVEDFGSSMQPEALPHLQRIADGVKGMGLLVDELLNLARVGRHTLKLQPTGLNSIIQEVITLLKPETAGRGITWKIAELPIAKCDIILIKQVFQNLLANAVKFTRPREHAVIEIGHGRENGQDVIFVRDNGVGFNMKYKDKLFGVFQRLHRTEDFEGTGIGLATVQRIVRKHGGRVWADSELDKGATFCFTLDVAESRAVETRDLEPRNLNVTKPAEGGEKTAAMGGRG